MVVKKFFITVCWNSLDDGESFNYFTQHIFTEHLLYSKHCSGCGEFSSEEEKQKKVMGFIYNTERLFGMESGALLEAMKPIFEKWLK